MGWVHLADEGFPCLRDGGGGVYFCSKPRFVPLVSVTVVPGPVPSGARHWAAQDNVVALSVSIPINSPIIWFVCFAFRFPIWGDGNLP